MFFAWDLVVGQERCIFTFQLIKQYVVIVNWLEHAYMHLVGDPIYNLRICLYPTKWMTHKHIMTTTNSTSSETENLIVFFLKNVIIIIKGEQV